MKVNFQTVSKTLLADIQTPVSIYLALRDLYPESVLMESSDFKGNENSYSIIGVVPKAYFKLDGNVVTEYYNSSRIISYEVTEQHYLPDILHRFTECFETNTTEEYNGFFGFSSFESSSYFEQNIPKEKKESGLNIPDMYYIFYKYILIIDHYKNTLKIIENIESDEESSIAKIEELINRANNPVYKFSKTGEEYSSLNADEYIELVKQGIDECRKGNVFQIVISRRFTQSFKGDDFMVYRSLRSINPSPYLFYFDFGSFRIFGSSPETHCRIKDKSAYIDPIAGTFKRTGSAEEDKLAGELLLKDPKENAEHIMLVDLARNDLSKNASSVSIDFFRQVHFYSHVIHLVSRVRGILPESYNPIKVFADTFPAGTLSGAPKIRALQLIYKLEPHCRNAYGGCIGYIGLNGNINQAITIRTFISKDNKLHYQAGAGIVAKSCPVSELNEVNNKLGALKKAINMAETL
ncbi:MAG: anthranilate synthase component I family protein [Bacteroidales bacterium]